MSKELIQQIPYDENGNPLSLKVYSDNVMIDDTVTLKEYLENIKIYSQSSTGVGIIEIQTWFKTFSSSVTNEEQMLSEDSNTKSITWEKNSPMCTSDRPNLWKKEVIVYTGGTTSAKYYFCGSLGQPGIDGESIEWIFKLSSTFSDATISELENELLSYYNSNISNFQENSNMYPNTWNDDMLEVSREKPYLFVATRKKKDGKWQRYSSPKLFAKFAKDGDTIYQDNVYTSESHKDTFDKSKVTFNSEGKINGLPDHWYTSVVDELNNTDIYQRTIFYKDSQVIDVSDPIKISGPKGDPGADGGNIEFIYYGSETELSLGQLPSLPQTLQNIKNNNPSEKWKDNASDCALNGTSIKFQYFSYRNGYYNNDNDWRWGEISNKEYESIDKLNWNYGWSEPALWSSWGRDGVDGNGVEYIYLRLSESQYNKVKDNLNSTLSKTFKLTTMLPQERPQMQDQVQHPNQEITQDGIVQ